MCASPGSVVVEAQVPALCLLLVVAVGALLPAVGAPLCVRRIGGRGARKGRAGEGGGVQEGVGKGVKVPVVVAAAAVAQEQRIWITPNQQPTLAFSMAAQAGWPGRARRGTMAPAQRYQT
jgi:hypothetical protein